MQKNRPAKLPHAHNDKGVKYKRSKKKRKSVGNKKHLNDKNHRKREQKNKLESSETTLNPTDSNYYSTRQIFRNPKICRFNKKPSTM